MTFPSEHDPPQSPTGDNEPSSTKPKGEDLLYSVLGDKYLLESILQEGNMGSVFMANRIADGEVVVVKTIPREGSPFFERFKREAEGLLKFNHPNIVQVLDFEFSPGKQPYIVLEYVDGVTLKAFLADFPKGVSLPFFFNIFQQLCDVLTVIHERGIIHRDFKPANIMLRETEEGYRVKVLDFGLILFARKYFPEAELRLTQRGAFLGTPTYMSPEQCQGNEVTFRTDLYNLGLTAYEMLAGHPPFEGNDLREMLMLQINRMPKPLNKLRADLPPALARAVQTALAKTPQNRFSSCWEFWHALAGESRGASLSAENIDQAIEAWADALTEDDPID